MEINGIPFDKALAVHSIALAYAENVFAAKLHRGENLGTPDECVSKMYRAYVRAFGHLSAKTDEEIMQQLEHR